MSKRGWAVALGGALAVAALVALQNTFRFGDQFSWWQLFRFELPVWLSWLAILPLILRLSRRFPLAGPRAALHAPVHLLAAAGSVFFVVVMTETVRQWTGPAEMVPLSRGVLATLPLIFALLIIIHFTLVAVAHAIDYRRAYNARSLREAQLEADLARARLEGLRAQLQPHFLFNTLNAISGSVTWDPPLARRLITRLSELLRVTVRSDSYDEVPLAEELEFISAYADIQKARFGSRFDLVEDVAEDALDCVVPGMILQPLVENAIQHGMPDEPQTLTVRITARTDAERLVISVSDDGTGALPGAAENGGVGIRNTAGRLAAFYGDAAGLRIRTGEERARGFAVDLHMPAREPAQSAARSGHDDLGYVPTERRTNA